MSVAPIEYMHTQPGNCPLCRHRPVSKKLIYGYPVCKKCFNAFANRRQLAYLIDSLLIFFPAFLLTFTLIRLIVGLRIQGVGYSVASSIVGILIALLFTMKDGFSGYSPGKWLMGVQVLDDNSGLPIGPGQSFRRNAIFLTGLIPVAGPLVNLAVIVIVAVQVAKGYRLGDRFAHTRVIWKKFAQLPVFGGNGIVCEQCGYDLHGNTSGVCPECGTAVSERIQTQLAAVPSELQQTMPT